MTDQSGIDIAAWKASRPAARRVRPTALAVTVAVVLVASLLSFALDSILLLLLGMPLLGWLSRRAALVVLSGVAVRAVLPSLAVDGLRALAVCDLVATGRAVVGGSSVIAVEDADSVTLTSAPGPGRGPELPLSAIFSLGRGDA